MSIFSKKTKEENTPANNPVNTTATETLGAKISRLRKEKGLTQDEFSQLLGVTPQAVSKWENDASCPDIMLLPKIAQLFEISVDELLGNSTAEKQEKKPDVDINKLNLKIIITSENKKPVNISFPMATVKKFTKLGTGISGIINLGTPAVDDNQLDKIFELVENGSTGELMNMTDENGQNIVIEIS